MLFRSLSLSLSLSLFLILHHAPNTRLASLSLSSSTMPLHAIFPAVYQDLWTLLIQYVLTPLTLQSVTTHFPPICPSVHSFIRPYIHPPVLPAIHLCPYILPSFPSSSPPSVYKPYPLTAAPSLTHTYLTSRSGCEKIGRASCRERVSSPV